MFFKRLEVNGFKSFAQKTDIEFAPGITAIVGPNGSGKSNVVDAVRWVLGEQSAKVLRGSKMEDVIFNGTEKRKPQSFCEVSLIFDNSFKNLPIDYTEVVITRRMYRSGESEYFINNAPCRLKDISEILRDTGIGKDGYSIIGQGRVVDILSNKGDERRAVFEEAAGIVKYKVRKVEAERKIERISGDLIRINDIITELSERLGPLNEQSQKAHTYLNLRDKLRDLEINSFLYQYTASENKRNKLRAQLSDIEEEYAQRNGSIALLQQEIDVKNDQIRKIQADIFASQQELAQLSADIERSEGQNNLLAERVRFLLENNTRLENENVQLMHGLEDVNKKRDNLINDKNNKYNALESEKAVLRDKEEQLQTATEQIDEREKILENTKQEIMNALNKLSDVRSSVARLNTMRDSIINSYDTIEKALREKENDCSNARQAAQELDKQLLDKNQYLKGLKDEYASLMSTINQWRDALEKTRAENEKLQAEMHATKSRLQMLEDMKRDYEGYQFSVKSILSACAVNKELDKKVCGVIAQLIKSEQRYELAIEMTLGAALQNIVVETEYDAKYIIEFLQHNKMGRATFMPINAIKGRTLNQNEYQLLASFKGCFGVASDLVAYEPKYKNIIENLLGRTVLVDTMDTGIQLARQSGRAYKIVTLAGDILNAGGSMTGGSINTKNTGLLSRSREIETAAQRLGQIETLIADNHGKIDRMLAQLNENKAKTDQLSAEIHNAEIIIARESERTDKLHKTGGDYLSQIDNLIRERENMRANQLEIEKELADINQTQGSIEFDRENAQKKAAQLQEQYHKLRSAYNEKNNEVTSLKIMLAEHEKDYAAVDAELTRLDKESRRIYALIEDNRRLIADNNKAIGDIETDSGKQTGILTEKKETLDQIQSLIRANDESRLLLDEDIQNLDRKKRDEEQNNNLLSERRHTLEMQLQKSENDIENLQLKIFEDYALTFATALAYKRDDFENAGVANEIKNIRKEIAELGAVNVNAIEEYRQTNERYALLSEQKTDLETAIIDLRKVIDDLENGMRRTFKEQFNLINQNFKQIFVDLFNGGFAELSLDDETDVLQSNITVTAQPPGKKLQTLSLLSGGEQALTAIAILLAMLKLKPTPFCILDEIESALDELNTYNFANYIKRFSEQTQFIVITHRKPTMENADVLFGVSMEEKGVSSLLSMKLGKKAQAAAS